MRRNKDPKRKRYADVRAWSDVVLVASLAIFLRTILAFLRSTYVVNARTRR